MTRVDFELDCVDQGREFAHDGEWFQAARTLAAEVRRMRSALEHLNGEVERAAEHLTNKDKGGMRVPFHGDFVQVPPSGIVRLRWHVKNIRGEK